MSFYNIILICGPQKQLSLLAAEDMETSEDKEKLAHRAQEMEFGPTCGPPPGSPLVQEPAKNAFLASRTSKSGNNTAGLMGYTAHRSQQEELNGSSKAEQ